LQQKETSPYLAYPLLIGLTSTGFLDGCLLFGFFSIFILTTIAVDVGLFGGKLLVDVFFEINMIERGIRI
jgi:hypothetical protein